MKPFTAVKLLGLVVLAILSSVITSQIYGQHSRSKSKSLKPTGLPSAAQGGATSTAVKIHQGRGVTKDAMEHNIAQQAGVPFETVSEYHLEAYDVQLEGHQVTVRVAVSVSESRPGFKGLWTLRVFRATLPEKTLFMEKHYVEQMFRLEGRKEENLTFEETTRLPAGEFWVQIALYSLPPTANLETLKDEKQSDLWHVISKIQKIVVRD